MDQVAWFNEVESTALGAANPTTGWRELLALVDQYAPGTSAWMAQAKPSACIHQTANALQDALNNQPMTGSVDALWFGVSGEAPGPVSLNAWGYCGYRAIGHSALDGAPNWECRDLPAEPLRLLREYQLRIPGSHGYAFLDYAGQLGFAAWLVRWSSLGHVMNGAHLMVGFDGGDFIELGPGHSGRLLTDAQVHYVGVAYQEGVINSPVTTASGTNARVSRAVTGQGYVPEVRPPPRERHHRRVEHGDGGSTDPQPPGPPDR